MCTNERFSCSRITHRSIVRELVHTESEESEESGCKSEDDEDEENLNLNTSSPNDSVIQTEEERCERLSSLSPDVCRKTNDNTPLSIKLSREQPFGTLLLTPLRETTTGDSGTGDSVIHIQPDTSPLQIPYEEVLVYGFSKPVFMANRYTFDPSKVVAYNLNPNRSIPPSPPSRSNSDKSKTMMNTLRAFFQTKKPSHSPSPFMPIVRHHSSQPRTDENR